MKHLLNNDYIHSGNYHLLTNFFHLCNEFYKSVAQNHAALDRANEVMYSQATLCNRPKLKDSKHNECPQSGHH